MASWNELSTQYEQNAQGDPNWLYGRLKIQLNNILKLRKTGSVIFYASAFLQNNGSSTSIFREDINGFMSTLYQASTNNRLTLILHTLGGNPNAVESIVEYLHSKFTYIEVIVPYLAMSGGAMMSLASDLLILGRQSQLGPIDPQFILANKTHSARAIQEGFNKAREDIKSDLKLAHFWAPILQNTGPSLFFEAEKSLSYSKELVANWLSKRMLKDIANNEARVAKANIIAAYFNAEETEQHGQIHVHGQRIGVEKLKTLGINLELLEDNQTLQNEVLTAYHLMTMVFEKTAFVKFIVNDGGKVWAKQQRPASIAQSPPAPQ